MNAKPAGHNHHMHHHGLVKLVTTPPEVIEKDSLTALQMAEAKERGKTFGLRTRPQCQGGRKNISGHKPENIAALPDNELADLQIAAIAEDTERFPKPAPEPAKETDAVQ